MIPSTGHATRARLTVPGEYNVRTACHHPAERLEIPPLRERRSVGRFSFGPRPRYEYRHRGSVRRAKLTRRALETISLRIVYAITVAQVTLSVTAVFAPSSSHVQSPNTSLTRRDTIESYTYICIPIYVCVCKTSFSRTVTYCNVVIINSGFVTRTSTAKSSVKRTVTSDNYRCESRKSPMALGVGNGRFLPFFSRHPRALYGEETRKNPG